MLVVIIILIVLSAFISAMETAITATSPGKIHVYKSKYAKNSQKILKILKIKNEVISTLLIGNNISNILCTSLATRVFIDLLGDSRGTLTSSILMSTIIIIFAEVIPKAIAVINPEKIVLVTADMLKLFLKLLSPLTILVSYIVRSIFFIFRINNIQPVSSGADEVRGMIEHHIQEGNVYRDDGDMLGGVLNIRDMTVSDIMTHRSNVLDININYPIDNIMKIILTSNYTRIPVWLDNKDNVVGVLHIRDLLHKIYANNYYVNNIKLLELLTPPVFVPDNVLLIQQLKNFRVGKSHMAFVVDEYGDLQGIITIEDILEEIVGQIYDEYDNGKEDIIKKSDIEYIIDGSMPIRDLNRELRWHLPETEAITLSGLMITLMNRIPNYGDFIIVGNLKLIVNKKLSNRVKLVQVIILSDIKKENKSD